MLVSHRKHFIYTKTAKTAGTSVESYFEPYCMPKGEWSFAHHRDEYESSSGIIGYRGPSAKGKKWFNHMPAQAIRDALGDGCWNSYLKFCVIRNPFDMLVSWFFFQIKRGFIEPREGDSLIDQFRERMANGIPVLGRPQYTISGEFCMDTVIRFERLHSDMSRVCKLVGVAFEPARIPQLKKGLRDDSIPLAEFYTPELVKRVEEAYAFELDKFGYGYEG